MRFLCLALLLPLYAFARPQAGDGVTITGDDARYLFELAVDPNEPGHDRVDFTGGCFFTLSRQGYLTRLFCEFSEGRLNRPDRLIEIVQPYLAFAPYPGVGDPDHGLEGRALGIEYACARRRQSHGATTHTCVLRDHFFKKRN